MDISDVRRLLARDGPAAPARRHSRHPNVPLLLEHQLQVFHLEHAGAPVARQNARRNYGCGRGCVRIRGMRCVRAGSLSGRSGADGVLELRCGEASYARARMGA